MAEKKSSLEYFVERYKCTPADAPAEVKATELKRLKELCLDKGFKPGFVGKVYKELFGSWPPSDKEFWARAESESQGASNPPF